MKRFVGEQKPPRVYIDNGTFFIAYWVAGVGAQRKSTGIKSDIVLPKLPKGQRHDPDWWTESEHAAELQEKILIASANRTATKHGKIDLIKESSFQVPSLETILILKAEKYKEDNDEVPLQNTTLHTYKRAIGALRQFNKHASLQNVTVADAKEFKKWMKGKEYADETKHLFIRLLRSIWKFAIEQGFIIPIPGVPPNPWKMIKQKFEPKLKEPQSIATEKKFFVAAYKLNRKLFDFTFFQRITGYSFADVKPITPDMRIGDIWHMKRTKMQYRPHQFPDSLVMRYHVDHMPHYDPMFGYEHVQTVNDDSWDVCQKIGIPYLTTSDFKDSYGEEFDLIVTEDRILAMLMHHQVKGESQMASSRYLTHLRNMRNYLDCEEVSHWLKFREALEEDFEGECNRNEINIRVLAL